MMSKLWAKFRGLPKIVQAIIIILILGIGVWIFDAATGDIRAIKNRLFDRQQAQIEQQNQKLLDENTQLRAQNDQLRADAKTNVDAAIKLKAEEAIFAEKENTLNAAQKQELDKLNAALQEQSQVEQQTAQETDPYAQCVRTKEKLLALKLPSATKINCEDLK